MNLRASLLFERSNAAYFREPDLRLVWPEPEAAPPEEETGPEKACELNLRTAFNVQVVPNTKEFGYDKLLVTMDINGKTLPVDEIQADELNTPPSRQVDLLTHVYTVACQKRLKINFEERQDSTGSRWTIDGGNNHDVVLESKGEGALEKAIAHNAGTEARRLLGWPLNTMERAQELYPRY